MPSSQSDRFESPAVYMSCPSSDKRITALVPVYFDINNPNGADGTTYVLSASITEAAGLPFSKTLTFSEDSLKFWVGLNSHILPNGRNSITFSLLNSRQERVWAQDLALHIANEGFLADRVRQSLLKWKSPLWVDGVCDSSHYDFGDESLKPWFDRTDALDHVKQRIAAGEITESEGACLNQFVHDGFLVLPDPIEEQLLKQIDIELNEAIARRADGYEYGTSQRIHNLHLDYEGIRCLWLHPNILRFLTLIFEATPRPCQTLTYVFGSQQDPHQDTIHLTPFPAGYMCGVWAALEDVRPSSGELEVYRGSHRLPRVYLRDTGCQKVRTNDWSEFGEKVVSRWRRAAEDGNFEKIVYRPKRGDVLIWHENLLHAGSVRIDQSLSRRSIVTHNFADGSIAFYDSTGMCGHMEPKENIGL